MADETLKIRVDVETAKVGQIKDAIKGLNKEINTAAREELPALIAQKQELTSTLNKLVPKSESFTQTVKDARKEARVFRFALLEMVHGVDGLGTAFGALAGAGEGTQRSIKAITGSMQEGLGAGLGLKFGLQAIGGSFAALAGPIGIAVGALTAIGGAVAHHREEIEKERVEMGKQIDRVLELEKALGRLTRAQYLNALQADILLAKQKSREAQGASIDILGTLKNTLAGGGVAFSGNALPSEVLKLKGDALEAEKKYNDAIKGYQKEDEEAQKQHEGKKVKTLAESLTKQEDLIDAWMATMQPKFTTFGATEGEVGLVGPERPGEQLTFEQQIGGWMAGIGVLQSGFAALSQGISSGIAQAFGEATSLFEMFVQGVVQGIAQIAEQLASAAIISGIFSLFGGQFGLAFGALTGFASGGTLYEPVVGMGASGRMYSFAENGPERIGSLTNFGGGQSSGTQRVIVEGRVRGRDIYYVNKQSQIIDRKMGGR